MNLVSCTIENFGGLSQRTFDFNDGLTVIEQPNGSGKTTLAAFIRCMLYGMPRHHKRDLDKDLRRRYAPWQGGAYGGQLVVHAGGRLYRIERRFGGTPKDDALAVFDQVSGKRTDELGAVPGITLFGLDADSFERSAYIPQNRLADALATADIKAKLGNLVDNTDGTRNFESAMDLLKKARAQQVPYRGQGGAHAAVVAQISQVSEELVQLSTAQGELERVRDREGRLASNMEQQHHNLAQVRTEIAEAADLQARRSMALECMRLENARKQAREEYQRLEASLGGAVSSEGEVHRANEALQCLDLVKQAGVTQADIDAFAAQAAQMTPGGEGVAGGEGTATPAPAQGAVTGTRADAAAPGVAGVAGGAAGAHGIPTADDGRYGGAEWPDDAPAAPVAPAAPAAATVKGGGAGIALVVVGVILLLAGATLAAMDAANVARVFAGQLYAGIAAAVTGIAFCVGGGIMCARHKKQAQLAAQAAQEAAQAAARAAEHACSLARTNDLIKRAFAAQRALESFCRAHRIDPRTLNAETLEHLRDNARALHQMRQNVVAADQAFSQFVEANGLCAWKRSDEDRFRTLDLQELQAQEQRLVEAQEGSFQGRVKDSQRIQTLQERVDKIPLLQDQLQTLTEQRKKIEKDVATLDATMTYLERAKEQLCATYAGPVQERFQHYFRMLVDETGAIDVKKVQVDSDFHMTYPQTGATRHQESLSAGYADLVMVCMRMALCDALYEKERPFIVMDDPFINVDDALMQRTRQLLEKLAENHQIIYFTCSNSRNMTAH